MRFVYILEDDAKFQKELVDAIQTIDAKIQVRLFNKLELFVAWVKEALEKGYEVIPTGGEAPSSAKAEKLPIEPHQLVTVIAKVEFLGIKHFPLLKKLQADFITKQICTNEDPTTFVLTAFEDPSLKIKDFKDPILSNVIYKPFDKVILVQHLVHAIDGRHPPSMYSISNQKVTALAEMLKDAKLDAISEVGFITRSEKAFDEEAVIIKFFGQAFTAGSKVSLMAKNLSSKRDPKNPNEYITAFSFYGINPDQLTNIRKKMKMSRPDYDFKWEKAIGDAEDSGRPFGIVIIDELEQNAMEIEESLKRKFADVEISSYKNFSDFLLDLDPKLAEGKGAKATLRAFVPMDKEISFIFDPTGMLIIDLIKPTRDPVTIFGVKEFEVKSPQFWPTAMGSENMEAWKGWLANPATRIFAINYRGHKFYIRTKSIARDPKTKNYKVTFNELSQSEREHFLGSNSRIPMVTDAILFSDRFLQHEDEEIWVKIIAALKIRAEKITSSLSPSLFLMTARDYSESELRQMGTYIDDVFSRPIDRSYLAMKLKLFCPEAEVKKDMMQISTFSRAEEISISNPISLTELSEAGLVFQYYRGLEIGSFRNFILWLPYDPTAPKLIGTCNFVRESSQKGIFENHFVFFGSTDHFLKAIRMWILENYINSKDKR